MSMHESPLGRPRGAHGSREVRRLHALARDEGRLREALAAHERRRFDVSTAVIVQERVAELLQTVEAIAADDDLWARLDRAADRPLTRDQLDRLHEVDGLALAALLEAAGYQEPPPPPADELVDETLASLAEALYAGDGQPPAARVVAARSDLVTLVLRVRKQIEPREPTPLQPSVLRTAGRTLGQTARWLLPRVAAVSAGALAESVGPGTGVGLVVGQVAKRVAQDGVELAALSMRRGVDRPDPQREAADLPFRMLDPVAVSVAALLDQLDGLGRSVESWADDDEGHVLDLARAAERTARRLRELTVDHATPSDHLTEVLRDIDDGVHTALRAAADQTLRQDEATEALRRAAHAADYLRHTLTAGPTAEPFGGR